MLDEKSIGHIKNATGASKTCHTEMIQSLWSGYGVILRVALQGAPIESVILKKIVFPSEASHPRGWHSYRAHERKVKSYEVEMRWYEAWSERCDHNCRVPKRYKISAEDSSQLIILEDLDAAGFPARETHLDIEQAKTCLEWLANFHATFMGEEPVGLWSTGTYWHLDTRPDELAAMQEPDLRGAAADIDALLNSCRFKTIVHGDAKVANFCFSENGQEVAAVDFQYVGGGCGMKDVAYFLGSCLDESLCDKWEKELLDHYFTILRASLKTKSKPIDCDAVESEWRKMYGIAWTDFHRFLMGWMPTHTKINAYSKRIARETLRRLADTSDKTHQ